MNTVPDLPDSIISPVSAFTLRLLGPPSIAMGDTLVDIPRRSVRALLYRLASDPEPVSRAHLHLLFWPDVPEHIARRSLTHHLTHLRNAAPRLQIQTDHSNWVRLDPSQVWCDVIAFQNAFFHASLKTPALRHLASLYRGPFLDGFDLPGHPCFEQWYLVERSRLERYYLILLEQLVERLSTCEGVNQAIEYAIRSLAIDPLSENMHRRLIRLYAIAGKRHLALQQFDQCRAILKTELGMKPQSRTVQIYEEVLFERFQSPC